VAPPNIGIEEAALMHRFRVGRISRAYRDSAAPVARRRSEQPAPRPYMPKFVERPSQL
jgi:hypothetical protein